MHFPAPPPRKLLSVSTAEPRVWIRPPFISEEKGTWGTTSSKLEHEICCEPEATYLSNTRKEVIKSKWVKTKGQSN